MSCFWRAALDFVDSVRRQLSCFWRAALCVFFYGLHCFLFLAGCALFGGRHLWSVRGRIWQDSWQGFLAFSLVAGCAPWRVGGCVNTMRADGFGALRWILLTYGDEGRYSDGSWYERCFFSAGGGTCWYTRYLRLILRLCYVYVEGLHRAIALTMCFVICQTFGLVFDGVYDFFSILRRNNLYYDG